MTKQEKLTQAYDHLCTVCETIAGQEKEDITQDRILGSAPDAMKVDDPAREKFIGMDQIDLMKFLLFTEQEFNKEVEDEHFVPRTEAVVVELWENRRTEERRVGKECRCGWSRGH